MSKAPPRFDSEDGSHAFMSGATKNKRNINVPCPTSMEQWMVGPGDLSKVVVRFV